MIVGPVRHIKPCGELRPSLGKTGVNLSFQGRVCSSCAARRNKVASSRKQPANIMPSGSQVLFQASGTDADVCLPDEVGKADPVIAVIALEGRWLAP